MTGKNLQTIAWGLSTLVAVVAIGAWGDFINWRFDKLNLYIIFPLLGMLAFSLMWVHYIIGALRRRYVVAKEQLQLYFDMTSALVLSLILLHPGLLVWQLWQDGMGLPPNSYKAYVGQTLYGFVLLGVIALVIFISYEFRRIERLKRYGTWLQYASDVAMLLIFVHGLKLGGTLQSTWFKWIWLFYGVTLLLAVGYSRWPKPTET